MPAAGLARSELARRRDDETRRRSELADHYDLRGAVQAVHGRRLLVWPYSPFGDPFGDRYFEESRLTDFCMRAKGYELVPADKIQPSPEGASSGKP